MNIPEVIESEVAFNGKLITITRDALSRSGKAPFIREVATTTDSVAVVALDELQRVLLVSQYRHPLRTSVWEIPAGRIDVEGEAPEHTALRELREEADIVASNIKPLTTFANSVGWTTEKTQVFLASDLKEVPAFERHDEEADIEKQWVLLADALEMIQTGQIIDAKTIIGILLAKALVG